MAEVPSKLNAKYIFFLEHIVSGIIMYLNTEFLCKMKAKNIFLLEHILSGISR